MGNANIAAATRTVLYAKSPPALNMAAVVRECLRDTTSIVGTGGVAGIALEEPDDSFVGYLYATQTELYLDAVEPEDTCHASLITIDQVVFTITEPEDGWEAAGGLGMKALVPDGEFVYVPDENQMAWIVWEPYLLKIQSESATRVETEEQSFRLRAAYDVIYVPPVESGPWY